MAGSPSCAVVLLCCCACYLGYTCCLSYELLIIPVNVNVNQANAWFKARNKRPLRQGQQLTVSARPWSMERDTSQPMTPSCSPVHVLDLPACEPLPGHTNAPSSSMRP